jgi:hypothetical protein
MTQLFSCPPVSAMHNICTDTARLSTILSQVFVVAYAPLGGVTPSLFTQPWSQT